MPYWTIALLLFAGIGFLACGGFLLVRKYRTKDDKPTYLSFILQRDDCSRLLGEFGEKHISECSKLVLVWQNGTDAVKAVHSDSVDRHEAIAMLEKAEVLIDMRCHGK